MPFCYFERRGVWLRFLDNLSSWLGGRERMRDESGRMKWGSRDIFWLRDESLEESDNLPDPNVLAQEIVEDLEAALEQFRQIAANCFKYRNKVGLDVALEALRNYKQKHRAGMDELWRFAKICRVERVMRSYLEALK